MSVSGNRNVALGYGAGKNNSTGNYNTFIGNEAGYDSTGTGNVFIGNGAGYSVGSSNQLYISNSSTSHLIRGDFSTGDLFLGQALGRVYVENDLSVVGDLYLGGSKLENSNGVLTWRVGRIRRWGHVCR